MLAPKSWTSPRRFTIESAVSRPSFRPVTGSGHEGLERAVSTARKHAHAAKIAEVAADLAARIADDHRRHATAAEIDEAMKLGCNHPIGPLALCDLIGLDVELAVMQVLYEGTKDPKYRPAPLLVEMLEAGYLGRKSGKGFYDYK